MLQTILAVLIGAGALFFLVWRFILSPNRGDGCGGCSGCPSAADCDSSKKKK